MADPHWLGSSTATLTNGSHEEVLNLMIDEVRIGNHTIHNVVVMALKNDGDGEMLLGFTTLNQIGPFTIDTRKQELIFRMELGLPNIPAAEPIAKCVLEDGGRCQKYEFKK
jgi:hypothetical protein